MGDRARGIKMDLTRTSRYLSMILRHKPEEIGISLDRYGWARTKDILKGLKIDMNTLETIVYTDNKQRYSFNEDKSKIRANQGHSIPVDVELQEVIPPKFLYYGTAGKYKTSIDKEGLIAKSRLYVHLSLDKNTAVDVGKRHGKPIVYKVDTEKMREDGYKFYKSVNNVFLTKNVPAKYLTIDWEIYGSSY